MKNTKLICLVFGICLSSMTFLCNAVDKTQTVPNGTTCTLKKGTKKPNKRPGKPDYQIVTCIYDNGELTIDFVMPEGMCDVVLTESSGATMSYTIDSSELTATVFVGTISESEIELTTENGNTYSGILTAE